MWHGFWKLTLLNRTAEYFYQCQSIGQTNSQSKKDGLQILCLIWHSNIYLHNIMLHRTCDLAICIQFNINLSKIHIRHTSDFYLGLGSHSAIRICIFAQLDFSLDGVTTDKKSSSILIYWNKDSDIYTENDGVD